MGHCPHCGAGGDQRCRSNCDGGYVEQLVCEACGERVEALHDACHDHFDADLCPGCYDNSCESAWERQQEDIMSGDGPLSLDEQHRRAWHQKQELRR